MPARRPATNLLVIAIVLLSLAACPAVSAATTPKPKEEPIEELDPVQVKKPDRWAETNTTRTERTINLFRARTVRKNTFLFVIDHRPRQTFTRNILHDFIGFDTELKVGIGLRYGILDNLDVGVYRMNGTVERFDVYELDVRYNFLLQARFFVNVAARLGVSWFVQQGARDAVGGFGQLLVDRTFLRWLHAGVGYLYHSESSNARKSERDINFSHAIQVVLEFRPIPSLELAFEMAASVAGYRSRYPAFGAAVKFLTHKHSFALVVTNYRYLSADGVVANSHRGFKQLVFGFTITRELKFW